MIEDDEVDCPICDGSGVVDHNVVVAFSWASLMVRLGADILVWVSIGFLLGWAAKGQVMLNRFCVLLCLVFAACTSREIRLGSEFAPLERVQEVSDNLMPPHSVTTIFSSACVPDLKTFEADYPPGPRRDALLLHERLHAIHQYADPVTFFVRYKTNTAFRWREESEAWRIEILHNAAHGYTMDPDTVASFLSGPVYDGMVSYSNAVAWVISVEARR